MAVILHQQQKSSPESLILNCEKYEEYLDSFVNLMDLRFVRDIRFCRKLVELGCRSSDIYTPEQFESQKEILIEQMQPNKGKSVLYGLNLKLKDPLLIELAQRERPNYQKIISTIIFLTHRSKNGFKVSAFIDFEASLVECNLRLPGCTNWEAVFQEKVKLRPKADDLSFYNIRDNIIRHNNSENYIVLHDVEEGLIFMHRGDHKKIFVDNRSSDMEQNHLRSVIYSPRYGHVVLFDHIVRKKI